MAAFIKSNSYAVETACIRYNRFHCHDDKASFIKSKSYVVETTCIRYNRFHCHDDKAPFINSKSYATVDLEHCTTIPLMRGWHQS